MLVSERQSMNHQGIEEDLAAPAPHASFTVLKAEKKALEKQAVAKRSLADPVLTKRHATQSSVEKETALATSVCSRTSSLFLFQ